MILRLRPASCRHELQASRARWYQWRAYLFFMYRRTPSLKSLSSLVCFPSEDQACDDELFWKRWNSAVAVYKLATETKYEFGITVQVPHCKNEKGTGNFFELRKSSLSPQSAYAFFNPASTRLGVKGPSRKRKPVASKIALPMAAANGIVAGSPAPNGAISGRLISTTSRSGTSVNLRIG